MRNVSQAVRAAIFGQESGEVFVPIVTIDHSSMAEPVYLVGDTVDLERGGQVYTAVPFSFTLPSDEEGQIQSIQLRISNVSRELVAIIRTLTEAPDITFEIVRVADPTDTVAGPWEMILRTVSYTALVIEGEIGRRQRLDVIFPLSDYSYLPQHFTGGLF